MIDQPGIHMLKAIRDIFEVLKLDIEDIKLELEPYTIPQMIEAIQNNKCPVVKVSRVVEKFQ